MKKIFSLLMVLFVVLNISIITSFAIDEDVVRSNADSYYNQYAGTHYPDNANGGSGCGAFLRGIWDATYDSSLSNTRSSSISTDEIDQYLKNNAVYGDAIWWNGNGADPHAMFIVEISSEGISTYESSGIAYGNVVSKEFRTYEQLHSQFKEGSVNFYHFKNYTATNETPEQVPTPSNNSLKVKTTSAKDITQTNAVVQGTVEYTGVRPSEFGIYFGTSKSNLCKVAQDPEPTFDMNPFPTWYDLNTEAGLTLEAGKTYYWQCYAIQDGNEVTGSIKSFKTQKSKDKAHVKTTIVESITSTNAVVRGEVEYVGSKPSEYGIYFGKSSSKMIKVAHDPEPDFDMNPYPIWYDLNVEAGLVLEPDTKYYWKCYVIQNGKEYKGTSKSFKTSSSDNFPDADEAGNYGGGGGGSRF